MTEIASLRKYNSISYSNPDDKITTRISGKWKNFFDSDDTFKPIDTQFVDVGTHFEVKDAPFIVKAPKTSQGVAEFISNNRYDEFLDEVITDEPFTQTIQAQGVSLVNGIIETGDLGWGETNYIVYNNAYPDLQADLIYVVHHGRAPRLKKIVRFNSQLNPVEDIRLSFKINYSSDPEILETPDELTLEQQEEVDFFKNQVIALEASNAKKTEIFESILAVSDSQKKQWDKQTKLVTKNPIAHRPQNRTSLRRGVGLKDFLIWDSETDPGVNKNIQKINVEYEKTVDGYILTKILPKNYFVSATYPVFTDTTSTFNPDANTETTSVDGWVAYYNATPQSDFSVLRDETGTTNIYVDDTAASDFNAPYLDMDSLARYNQLGRAMFLFDTSSLPTSPTISSATLKIYGRTPNTYADTFGDAQLVVCSATPASNTALTTEDYDQIGRTEFSDLVDVDTWIVDYNVFTLNASGIAAISDSGVSKFSVQLEYDRADNPPTGISTKSAYVGSVFADNGSNEPVLEVTYTGGGVETVQPTGFMTINTKFWGS